MIRRGSDYKIVVNNIKKLLKIKEELNLKKPKVSLATTQFLRKIQKIEPKVPKMLIDEFKGFNVEFKSTYAMKWYNMKVDKKIFSEIKGKENNSNYCDFIINTIVIRADGIVVPCCYDLTTKCPMGNVLKDSLIDIWNNVKYTKMRKTIHNKEYIPLCRNCGVINSSLYLCLRKDLRKTN